MATLFYQGYVTKEKAALQYKVKVRTINDWIRKPSLAPEGFGTIVIDGYTAVRDRDVAAAAPPGISMQNLQWIHNFGDHHKIYYERILEEIIKGKINCVVLCDRLFVDITESAVQQFAAAYQRRRKVKRFGRV